MTIQTTEYAANNGNSFDRRAKKIAIRGMGICILFLGLVAASSFLIKIEGSVISPSEVISAGKNKVVQHRDGGTIKELLVKDGDYVKSGDPLLVLDGQAIEAEYKVMQFRQVELRAKISRLLSTRDNHSRYTFNQLRSGNMAASSQELEIAQAIKTQEELFYATRKNRQSNRLTLETRHRFLLNEISALDSQIATTSQQLKIIQDQLDEVAPLIAEKLVARSREWALNRDMVNAQSQLDSLNVLRVKSFSSLNETENELSMFETKHRETLLNELEAAQTELQSVGQNTASLAERLSRLVVKAPVSGMVHGLQFQNAQAVLRPGDTVMEIVPQDSGHQLLARIKPVDIDQVAFGQDVRLRFEAFDANSTPELFGRVKEISADRFTDPQTGLAYYEVSIEMGDEQLALLGNKKIVPGMPATAMFRTIDRSLFSYLTKPLEQHTLRAFH